MRVVRSTDDTTVYDIMYTDDLSIFDEEFEDDDFYHVDYIPDETTACGVAMGILYGNENMKYAAVLKTTYGLLEGGGYGCKKSKVVKEYYATDLKEETTTENKKYS